MEDLTDRGMILARTFRLGGFRKGGKPAEITKCAAFR